MAGDHQHWDCGTPRKDCLHLNCAHTGESGNRYDLFIASNNRTYIQGVPYIYQGYTIKTTVNILMEHEQYEFMLL